MTSWDERFRAPGFAYGSEPNDFLKAVRPRLSQLGRALCLAEGEGRNAVYLAQQGFEEVIAMDSSRVGLEKADALAAERGVANRVKTVVADLREFTIEPNHFDAVVFIWCHMAEPLRTQVHRAAIAGLKPGGAFILESYTPRQLQLKTGGPPSVDMLQRLEDLDLRSLRVEIAHEIDRDIVEGRYHKGTSAVVQVFGVKP